VEALQAGSLEHWEKDSTCQQRPKAEFAMYLFKQLIGPKLSLRDYSPQVSEIQAGIKVMNKVIRRDMPVRQLIN